MALSTASYDLLGHERIKKSEWEIQLQLAGENEIRQDYISQSRANIKCRFPVYYFSLLTKLPVLQDILTRSQLCSKNPQFQTYITSTTSPCCKYFLESPPEGILLMRSMSRGARVSGLSVGCEESSRSATVHNQEKWWWSVSTLNVPFFLISHDSE